MHMATRKKTNQNYVVHRASPRTRSKQKQIAKRCSLSLKPASDAHQGGLVLFWSYSDHWLIFVHVSQTITAHARAPTHTCELRLVGYTISGEHRFYGQASLNYFIVQRKNGEKNAIAHQKIKTKKQQKMIWQVYLYWYFLLVLRKRQNKKQWPQKQFSAVSTDVTSLFRTMYQVIVFALPKKKQ